MNNTAFSIIIQNWFSSKSWTPFDFQKEVWEYYSKGYSGLLNAPTGSGKTYALWFAVLMDYILKYPNDYKKKKEKGLQLIWITPLKALSKDIEKAIQETCDELENSVESKYENRRYVCFGQGQANEKHV